MRRPCCAPPFRAETQFAKGSPAVPVLGDVSRLLAPIKSSTLPRSRNNSIRRSLASRDHVFASLRTCPSGPSCGRLSSSTVASADLCSSNGTIGRWACAELPSRLRLAFSRLHGVAALGFKLRGLATCHAIPDERYRENPGLANVLATVELWRRHARHPTIASKAPTQGPWPLL